MKGLTEKQHNIAQYIRDYLRTRGCSPSYREIQSHFGYASLSSVFDHLQALKKKGALSFDKNAARSITLPENQQECQIPLIGSISEGNQCQLFEEPESLALPRHMIPRPESSYALKVSGHSLQEEMIDDGDILIMEGRGDADNGETAYLSIGGMFLIKKVFYEDDELVLKSRLEGVDPIMVRSSLVEIHGIIVLVFRSF